MTSALITAANAALEDKKAQDITQISLAGKSSMAESLIIATGTSRPHVLALAAHVCQAFKALGAPPLSTEGEKLAEWVLVDAGDVVVHIFQPEARAHYRLEKLWAHHVEADTPHQDDLQLDLTAT